MVERINVGSVGINAIAVTYSAPEARFGWKWSCPIYFGPQNLLILWGRWAPNQILDLVG
jgi:hypothetical protein